LSIHANVNPVFHGLGLQYDHGETPAVALTQLGRVVEVHRTEKSYRLYHRVGDLNEATIIWKQSILYGTGMTPHVAANNHRVVVEVHKNEATGRTLYYTVGRLTDDRVDWGQPRRTFEYATGISPSVALDDTGVVVEVHEAQYYDDLWYRLGKVQGNTVEWKGGMKIGRGVSPGVAMNNASVVVEVHGSSSTAIAYRVGHIVGTKIVWGRNLQITGGRNPSVALTDDGTVIITFEYGNKNLIRWTGTVKGKEIEWSGEPLKFDDGVRSSVAASSPKMSVEVHEGEFLATLWFSTSLFTNRASWMEDRLSTLGNTKLRDLVLPASHDSGMYLSGIAALGKTQQLSLYGQLTAGVRYFDLRIMRNGPSGPFVIYHGPIIGPLLSTVLEDIGRYAAEERKGHKEPKGRKELIILTLYFPQRTAAEYELLVTQISASLGRWLVKSRPSGKRLADMTLNEYVAKGPAILIAVYGEYAVNAKHPGFWVYRRWDSDARAAAEGDLRVFDEYSDTVSFTDMQKHQFDEFEKYNGKMKHDQSLPCDLFLFSWTLTPATGVWFAAQMANRRLGEYIIKTPPRNRYGQMINLLFVDYVEYARVTDVALFRNGERTTASEPRRANHVV
jgi:hypothetical protein